MKSRPECNRTFEDSFTFCLIDGSVLSAPIAPNAILTIPEPRQTKPPPTEVLRPQEEVEREIPPTIASTEPPQKPQELVSTIAAPAPVFESSKVKALPAQSAPQSNRLPLIMIIGALLMFGFILFIIANRANSTNENAANINTATANRSNSSTAVSNPNQTSNAGTPSPSPSLIPVTNLEGTVWKGFLDKPEYDRTLEFKAGGKVIEKSGSGKSVAMGEGTNTGSWALQGNQLTMKFPRQYFGKDDYFHAYRVEATVEGDEIKGDVISERESSSKSVLIMKRVK